MAEQYRHRWDRYDTLETAWLALTVVGPFVTGIGAVASLIDDHHELQKLRASYISAHYPNRPPTTVVQDAKKQIRQAVSLLNDESSVNIYVPQSLDKAAHIIAMDNKIKKEAEKHAQDNHHDNTTNILTGATAMLMFMQLPMYMLE